MLILPVKSEMIHQQVARMIPLDFSIGKSHVSRFLCRAKGTSFGRGRSGYPWDPLVPYQYYTARGEGVTRTSLQAGHVT